MSFFPRNKKEKTGKLVQDDTDNLLNFSQYWHTRSSIICSVQYSHSALLVETAVQLRLLHHGERIMQN